MKWLVSLAFLLAGCLPILAPQEREGNSYTIKLPSKAPAYIVSASATITDWLPANACKHISSLRYADRSIKCKPGVEIKVVTPGEVVVLEAESPLEP